MPATMNQGAVKLDSRYTSFLAGFGLTGIQLLANEAFSIVFPQSSISMALSLGLSFLGLALANYLASSRLLLTLRRPESIVFGSVAFSAVLVGLFNLLLRTSWDTAATESILATGLRSVGVLVFLFFLPACLLGFLFPLANTAFNPARKFTVPTLNLWDIVGALHGLTVFALLLRTAGLTLAAWVFAALLMVNASYLSALIYGRKLLTSTLLAGGLFLWLVFPGDRFNPQRLFGKIIYQQPSAFGLVTVGDDAPDRLLFINRRAMCSRTYHTSEAEMVRLALKAQTGTQLRAMDIGLGCGFTAAATLEDPRVKELRIIEINPAVAEASQHFWPAGRGPQNDPRSRVEIADGEKTSSWGKEPYDIIAVDVEEPVILHSAKFYTVDFFSNVQSALKSGGVFTLWSFHHPRANRIMLNSLKKVFAYAEVRVMANHAIFLAANVPLPEEAPSAVKQFVKAILDLDETRIATVSANPLPNVYSLGEVFTLPRGYRDPFEIKP